MIIYRIEHSNGIGPYINKTESWIVQNHCDDNHPFPKMEGLPYQKSYHCGFKNKRSLIKWFNKEELRNLKKLGYKLVKYKVHSKYVHVGNYQVVFDKPKARLLIRKEIED